MVLNISLASCQIILLTSIQYNIFICPTFGIDMQTVTGENPARQDDTHVDYAIKLKIYLVLM